jgi:acyl transferase domain-containing protein/thioesterase domain-containing protein
MTESNPYEGVAVVGLAGRFPRAATVEQFWENLVVGRDCFTQLTVKELIESGVPREVAERPEYVRRCSVIEDPAGFDAKLFKYSPKEAELIDPQQRILLECAWEALENAGHDPHRFPGLVGIWAGSGVNNYFLKNILSRPGSFETVADFQTIISNDKDYLASRIAYKLDLRGPAVVVQTACSTSLVAVHMACLSLLTYQCDMALAGGVFLQTPRAHGYLYREGEIFSPDGVCRTFDRQANGTVLGEGCGLVVLRRMEDAIKDRDNILAIIRGSAINNDGAAKAGYTAPGVTGQIELVTMAQAVAGVRADEVSYIEAHGTGTALGDPIEVSALTQAFRRTTAERGFCGIGSVKTNIGHLDVAAGIAGLIKTICALQHRQLPPTLHFKEPNPELRLAESPFTVVDKLTDWKPRNGRRIAGVSSFGIGGTNAHVIVEEYSHSPSREPSRRQWHILPTSAATTAALNTMGANLASFFKEQSGLALGDISKTLVTGRAQLQHRQCVVAESLAAAAVRFDKPDALYCANGETARGGRQIVFLFSGQGTQYPAMGIELYRNEPVFRDAMDSCSRLLGPLAEKAFLMDILSGSDAELEALVNQTEISQQALFAFEYSLARLWESYGVRPSAVVGHSIGEYAAACEAGIFSLEDALHLVRERGRLMQSMVPGTMIAIPRSESVVREMLPDGLDLAVINAPEISVVSGPTQEVEDFTKELENRGISFRRLQTSHGFHSRMMEPAARAFELAVRRVSLKPPRIPIAANFTGGWMTDEQAIDPVYWANHLRHSVRFSDNLRVVAQRFNSPILLEIGPGNTLCAIARQHAEDVAGLPAVSSVRHPRQHVPDQAFFLRALGALWCHGAAIDLSALNSGEVRSRVPLPGYPFERQRYWIGGEARKAKDDGWAGFRLWRSGRTAHPERPLVKKKTGEQRQLIAEDLIQIWCNVLGTQNIGLDDNFFDLGGHSLMAVNIIVELEKIIGVRLPLATLIEAPTIRQFIRLLDTRKSGSSWSCMVPLHTTGSKKPFFFMHSHGGNILEYRPFVNLLKNDRPIYALQCRGLDGSPLEESSIEEMAAAYLKEVRAVQPQGPYFLGGYCFGGHLALEIAHLLRAQREEVGLIVMISSATSLFPVYKLGTTRMQRKWFAIMDRLVLEWEGLSEQPFKKKFPYLMTRAKRMGDLAWMKIETMLDRDTAGSRVPLKKHSLVYHLEQIAKANDRSWARYRPKPYDGRVLFLRTRRQQMGIQPDPLLGWGGVLTGEVQVHELPGLPQTVLHGPNVREIARIILEHLP